MLIYSLKHINVAINHWCCMTENNYYYKHYVRPATLDPVHVYGKCVTSFTVYCMYNMTSVIDCMRTEQQVSVSSLTLTFSIFTK